jgi:hypothetical protein
MLINKGIAVGEVITIKTTAGEEIVAKLVENTDTSVTVSKPVCLTATAKGVGMVPFLFTVAPEVDITLSKQTIMCIAPTTKDASDLYTQNTTGIALK